MMIQGGGGNKPKAKEVELTDESLIMSAIKLSEELQIGSFDRCYQALKLTRGDEERAIEEMLK